MTQTHYRVIFKKALLQFVAEPDPVPAMLEWVAGQMMQIEAGAKVPHKKKRRFVTHLKQIWLQPDRKSSRRAADQLIKEYGGHFPEAIRCLAEALENFLQFYSFPEVDPKKIASTNMFERKIRDVRRRSRVIEIFPTIDSWVRLETC